MTCELFRVIQPVASIDLAARKAGGDIQAPIDTMPWGERMFYAKHPFGKPISFVDQRTLFVGTPSGG